MGLGFSFWYKKANDAKKRNILFHRTLKLVTTFTTQTRKSKKENESFVNATIFCCPERRTVFAPREKTVFAAYNLKNNSFWIAALQNQEHSRHNVATFWHADLGSFVCICPDLTRDTILVYRHA